MIPNFEVVNGYSLIKQVHAIISIAFLILAAWLIIRSILGIIKNNPYTGLDKFLSYAFLVNLYLQLIFGLILFSNPNTSVDNNYSNAEGALKMVSNRFWPIEHIVLMFFALFIANLGLIFSIQSLIDKEKHRKILTYYVVSLIMIAVSLIAI
ncbi:MAG TPA: hypothetical protein VGK38_07985 [Prolixibacteraceae bacterium]|jgi:predicted ferric reductase